MHSKTIDDLEPEAGEELPAGPGGWRAFARNRLVGPNGSIGPEAVRPDQTHRLIEIWSIG